MAVTVKPRSSAYQQLLAGSVWVLDVRVCDADGDPAADLPTVTVTDPNGAVTTPTVIATGSTGGYRAEVPVTAMGRWVADVATAASGAAAFAADVAEIVAAAAMPSIYDLDVYLGEHSATDADLEEALTAERAAQADKCGAPAVYPANLRSALLRRCARHLAMKRIPLAVLSGDADSGPVRLPGNDPEVRRLEASRRRLPTG